MKAIKKVLFSMIIILASNLTLQAHATDQITYVFDQEKASLMVHLTPKGAMDLIESLQPELLQEEVLYLNAYYEVYTSYFNRTIDFKVNGEKVKLAFSKSELNQHDASLEFQLEGFVNSFEDFSLSIRSFTEIYRRVQNHVQIKTPLGQRHFLLDKINQICTIETLERRDLNPDSKQSTALASAINNNFWIGGFLVIGLGILLLIFEIKIFRGSEKTYYS